MAKRTAATVTVPQEVYDAIRTAALWAECFLADPEVGCRKGYDQEAKKAAFHAADTLRAYERSLGMRTTLAGPVPLERTSS